jgi:small subunit ribosomal protein S6
LTRLYETMVLIDNQVVREDWVKAKASITDAFAKHGGKVVSSRRWDERRLAYPIANRRRATFVLSYVEIESENLSALRRDFELSERVLRYLVLKVEKLPEGELEKAQAEQQSDFVVPPPPADDAPEPEPVRAQREPRRDDMEIPIPDLNELVEEGR